MDQDIRCTYVGADEFQELMLSRRELVRTDDRANGIRGLLDPSQRVKYLIRERDLYIPPNSLPRVAEAVCSG